MSKYRNLFSSDKVVHIAYVTCSPKKFVTFFSVFMISDWVIGVRFPAQGFITCVAVV